MYIIKRDGRRESIQLDKITTHISKLCNGLDSTVDPIVLSKKVMEEVYDGMTTIELNLLIARIATSLIGRYPGYALIASSVSVSNLDKNSKPSFSSTMADLYNCIATNREKSLPQLNSVNVEFLERKQELLDTQVIYEDDFGGDRFVFNTVEGDHPVNTDPNLIVDRQQAPAQETPALSISIFGQTDYSTQLLSVTRSA
ncbi:MAG: ATP cone domain-containing protein [Salibacteraceae bacterium]